MNLVSITRENRKGLTVRARTQIGLKSLNLAGGVVLVGTGFLFTQVFIPFWNDLFSLQGMIYPGLLMLAVLSLGLSRRNPRHGKAVAITVILVTVAVIVAVAAVTLTTSQMGSMGTN